MIVKDKRDRRDEFARAVAPNLLRRMTDGTDWNEFAKRVFDAADALLRESEFRAMEDEEAEDTN
jgi:hypothetical protein